MTKKGTILKRLGGLVPDVEKIAQAYGVDQKRALKIQSSISVIFELFGDLILEQAVLIEGQAETALLIEREMGRGRDAQTILSNIDVFLSGDVVTVEHILNVIFAPVFAEAFGRLNPERQRDLFAALRFAINSLKRQDGVLTEPE